MNRPHSRPSVLQAILAAMRAMDRQVYIYAFDAWQIVAYI